MVRILTRNHGKVTSRLISGKKLSSKLAGNCEPFMVTQAFFAASKTIDILAGSVPIQEFSSLRNDPYRYACAGFFTELVDRLTEDGDVDASLYEFVVVHVEMIHTYPAHVLLLFSAVLQLCEWLGYHTELYKCHNCQKDIQAEEGNQWNLHVWSVQCPRCVSEHATIPMSQELIKVIRFLVSEDIDRVAALKVETVVWQQTVNFVLACVHYLVGGELRSEAVLFGLDWRKR